MLRPRTLRVEIADLLSLPHTEVNPARSRYVNGVRIEPIPGRMGIYLYIDLKAPFLLFRDGVVQPKFGAGSLYHLTIEANPKPNPQEATRLLGARILPGRDGTLLVIEHTGSGKLAAQEMDQEKHVVRLRWNGAAIDPRWRNLAPQGLIQSVSLYEFARNQVEMELALAPEAVKTLFHADPASGTLIVEMRRERSLGRDEDAKAILALRRSSLERGAALPLNRLTPVFQVTEEPVDVGGQMLDEGFFYDNAETAAKDLRFDKARAFLDKLTEVFPNTANRELIDFRKVELAQRMNWRPGWLLDELNTAMARHPNNYRYPEFRLLQLQLLNDAHQYNSAKAVADDPNLPQNDPRVTLERGRILMGMEMLEESERFFNLVARDPDASDATRARANLYQALAANKSEEFHRASMIVRAIPPEQLALLNNDPVDALALADIYYANRDYGDALSLYTRLITTYPDTDAATPWAMLRAAQSHRYQKRIPDALTMLDVLETRFPKSGAVPWARIFRIQIDEKPSIEDRIKAIDELVKDVPISDAIAEAYLTKAQLQGEGGQYLASLETLKRLLVYTSRKSHLQKADRLKRLYLTEGMQHALDNRRPEYALLLGESHGTDWRGLKSYEQARLLLAEAMLRMGLYSDGLAALGGMVRPPAPQLSKLGEELRANQFIPLMEDARGQVEVAPAAARVRLDEAARQLSAQNWKAVLMLLDKIPPESLNQDERADRLRYLARAEAERGRFPQAVNALERLLFGKPVGAGHDAYQYATVLQAWKGDDKALPAFQEAAKGEDNEVRALARIRIGDILQRRGDLAGAEASYREASQIDPNAPWGKMALENADQLKLVLQQAAR
ncbi:hypothetical protein MAIT1_01535 [Magnetofaba australis IT-1]|uniref:Tetratricopeptide repeat protein n=1 Tax=Magnetofaba australis IT-1 TaxID=1434232 RepID=A0A1Y2K0I2_9PROT|nr:hypothetical protein MAIT1_01535 [Magnetofaba australis IT-1]